MLVFVCHHKKVKVHFKYESQRIETIICQPNEKVEDICRSFSIKNHFDLDSALFIINERTIEKTDFNKPIKQFVTELDNNNVYILVYNILNSENEKLNLNQKVQVNFCLDSTVTEMECSLNIKLIDISISFSKKINKDYDSLNFFYR